MRVACPECSAAYELPLAVAARLGEGRPLRCARCGHTWTPAPASPAPAASPARPEASPRPEPSPPDGPAWPTLLAGIPAPAPAPAQAPAPAGRRAALLARLPRLPVSGFPANRQAAILAAAWAASLLLLAGGALAAWHWRVDLVEAWPPAARAFMALGLAG